MVVLLSRCPGSATTTSARSAIPLLRGRVFDRRDVPGSPGVVVISEALAQRYFPGEDPVGQRLKHGGPSLNNPYWEIIGVVADVKYQGLAAENAPVY
jgi:putative ABC transport system permease protein